MARVSRSVGEHGNRHLKLSNSWRDIARLLHEQARPSPEFLVLAAIASSVATLGLLMNNGTAIVGAVLIAPLMGPILSLGFSTLTGRKKSASQALYTLGLGIGIIILVSYLVSLPFSTVGITDEMENRTQPTLLNLLIAFPAGFLAGYTRIRKSLSDKVYGVAMSVALLPPLCITGIALVHDDPSLLGGALLMFVSNLTGVMFSSILAFALAEFQRLRSQHFKRLSLVSLLILLLSIPLSFSFLEVAETNRLHHTVLEILSQKRKLFPHYEILDIDTDLLEDPIGVEVTLQTSGSEQMTQAQLNEMQAQIDRYFGRATSLVIHLIPVQTFYGPTAPQSTGLVHGEMEHRRLPHR